MMSRHLLFPRAHPPAARPRRVRHKRTRSVTVCSQEARGAVAEAAGLGFIPLAEEHYDFALVTARKNRPAVQAFLEALASEQGRAALARAGFRP